MDVAVDYDVVFPVRTQVEVLERLPQWMVADFDCPRGPHEWLGVATMGADYRFCKHCDRRKRTPCLDDMLHRDPLEVIAALQSARRPLRS